MTRRESHAHPGYATRPIDQQFGPLSATALVTIRQRLNMNAVRLSLNAREYGENATYRTNARRLIRNAGEFDLAVIVEADSSATAEFWKQFAAEYKIHPASFSPLSAK